ncbi:MAG TPA: c-type cytochrome [Bacteroidales bacterium]|nr:c-type cytochrome [Bacteroidales bacterium]
MRYTVLTLALSIVLFSACDRTRSSTGWDYMPDMYYSEAYETYTPNENFEDGQTMRTPVEGSVPREMIPFPYEKTDEDRLLAGSELNNPIAVDNASVAEGARLYGLFCVTCHGDNGDGQGFLYTSQRYPYPPASLVNERVTEMPDGEIYHAITVGYGVMGQHGSMISQDARWQIVNYIRAELQQ